MTPIRLRYPKGVTTIQVRDDFTVQDLQQEIYAASDILPSRQSLKAGYPPKVLTIVPELPITSLGLNPGEQIIVSELQVPAAPSARSAPVTQSSLPSRNDLLHTRPSPGYTPSAPASIPPASAPPGLDYVDTDGGVLIHRIVPDDNSCLFSAVALIFKQDISKAPEMRKIVAQGIRNDPETYTEAILGMPPSRYTAKILNPSTWGGAIELGILASHFRTEIASIDVETGRIDHFSPQDALGTRCILIYSGIHYDAATLAPMLDAPSEWHQTMFPVQSSSGDDPVLVAAKKLADILRGKKAYTNTSIFDLKCEECGQGLKGEKGARAHAEQTGHVRFGEH